MVVTDCTAVVTDCTVVVTDCAVVVTDCAAVVPDCAAVVTDCAVVVTGCTVVVTDCAVVKSELMTASQHHYLCCIQPRVQARHCVNMLKNMRTLTDMHGGSGFRYRFQVQAETMTQILVHIFHTPGR